MGVETIKLIRPLTTRELALAFGVTVGCVRNRHAASKSFMGIRPMRLPNGHLRWPAERVAELLGKDGQAHIG